MKSSKSKSIFRPFEDLNILLKNRSLPSKEDSFQSSIASPESEKDSDSELAAFEKAMAGVKKIKRDMRAKRAILPPSDLCSLTKNDSQSLLELEKLVKNGAGFVVAQTPEYIEGTSYNVNPAITKRLHRGDFSVQSYIDLHGMRTADARQEFENFLKLSVAAKKRMILIIHGRGLSSPGEPILKNKVYEWLTTGPWRKWVMAFSSARWCDGGAGATYVLLRQRPLTRRYRKKWKAK